MSWRRAWSAFRLALLLLLAAVFVAPEWPAFGDPAFRLNAIIGQNRRFDFLTWTIEALGTKAEALLAGAAPYLGEGAKKQLVLDYLKELARAQALEVEIERIYADAGISDTAAATADMQAGVDAIRRELARRQPLAEAIVQRQVTSMLGEEGLALGGLTLPPVLMTMSAVPSILVVSPRDRIEPIEQEALIPGLSIETREEMESAVLNELDQSALVVPIGGLGTYPAMIRETSDIQWLAQVTAHEWTHHWLSLHPLGIRYLESAEMRSINETVASLVDREMGRKVMERYYPELVAPPINPSTPAPAQGDATPAFDFGQEMAETRTTVDRLLAAGKVEEAEAYMEQRRRVFVEHGYLLRKLNQAYFAFYGGYAAEPGGAAGTSPIGPMLRQIRDAVPSLREFLRQVGRVAAYDDLVELYRNVTGSDPAALSAQP